MASTTSSNNSARWNVKVSKEADRAVRTLLAVRGMKKGDLSKFVDEAVRWRVFRVTVERAREKFADIPADELDALIDEALRAARAERRADDAARR